MERSSVSTRRFELQDSTQKSGVLFVCSTPIGNLGDITIRVIEALSSADAILAEDTRVTRQLLAHLGINTPLERCDENVIRTRKDELVTRIADGQRLVLVSDAGTPSVSDPGAVLVAAVRASGLDVRVLPGPSAVLAALTTSGFLANGFYFGGFFPRRNGLKTRLLQSLAELDAILVFFESAGRTVASLQAVSEVMPERRVCLARELTKLFEEVLIDTAAGLVDILVRRQADGQRLKGEIVILIDQPIQREPRVHRDKYSSLNQSVNTNQTKNPDNG
jgi:16S rRNA (cytidine1402-2'-O)-methyltransferase